MSAAVQNCCSKYMLDGEDSVISLMEVAQEVEAEEVALVAMTK